MNAWSGDHLGMYHSLSTIDRSGGEADGTRSYAVTGYLLPNAQRPNLRVLTEALVERLVVSPDGTVSGVEFEHGGNCHKVSVKKEVVLSAGVVSLSQLPFPILCSYGNVVMLLLWRLQGLIILATLFSHQQTTNTKTKFKTPQILELSGIGNPSILTAAGIKPIINNPRIGENFHDHPATGFGYELADGEHSLDSMQDPSYVETVMAEYASTRSGPLSTGGAAMGFVSYADLATPAEVLALQDLMLSPTHGGHTPEAKQLLAQGIASKDEASIQIVLLPASLNVKHAYDQTKFFEQPPEMAGKHGFLLGACIARPLSVGTVHIASSDPKVDPEIDPAYLSHPADVEIFSKGLAIVEKMVNTSPFKEKVKRRYYPDGPLDLSDKKAVETYVRGNVATEYHPLGSCAMGKEGVGAVDDRLKVYGCKGVRVVDASVIPLHVSGNIVATVYAVAEKGADLIKEDWKL